MENLVLYDCPKISKQLNHHIDLFMEYNYKKLYNNIFKNILKDLEKNINKEGDNDSIPPHKY